MTVPHAFRRLARLALAWFVVSLGVAVASPMVQAQRMERICSAGGQLQWVQIGAAADEGAVPAGALHHTQECPLCLGPALPAGRSQPSFNVVVFPASQPEQTRSAPAIRRAYAFFAPRAPPAAAGKPLHPAPAHL